jgi:hypothetical protein
MVMLRHPLMTESDKICRRRGLGGGRRDADTAAAIAGGVVAAYTGVAGIPADWAAAREPLPGSLTAADSIGGDPHL